MDFSRLDINSFHAFVGSGDASAEKAANTYDTGYSTRKAEVVNVELPGNMDTVAKPLSMWFDGLCSRKIVIDSRKLM